MMVSTGLIEALAADDAPAAEVLKRWAAARSPHAVDARVTKQAP
jgi:hypothetical protein